MINKVILYLQLSGNQKEGAEKTELLYGVEAFVGRGCSVYEKCKGFPIPPKNDMDIVFSSISNALGNHIL